MSAFFGAALSAALYGLAARVESPWHWVAFVALAPWMAGLRNASRRAALLSAVLFAMAYAAAVFPWMAGAIGAYSGASKAVAWAVLLAAAPIFIEPQALAAVAGRLFAPRRPLLFFALSWLAAEWLLPRLFADTLGYAFFPSERMRQAADLAGVRGLSALALLSCALLSQRKLKPALAALAIPIALQLYGALRLRAPDAATPTMAAGVVQAAITNYDKLAAEQGSYETVRQIVETHLKMSEQLLAQGPLDVVVWPETVYPTTFGAPKSEEGAFFDHAIAGFTARTGVPLIFGAFVDGDRGEGNAAFFLGRTEAGISWDAYAKSLLFPLTERVPGWLDSPRVRKALPWLGHWHPGPGPRALPLRLRDGSTATFAPLICYEAIDPGYVAAAARDADVIVTLSNDSWFPDERAPRLHLIAAAFRSIETRRPQIRATNSGISALLLPSGEIVSPSRFGERAGLRLVLPRAPRRWTPAAAFGDWLGPACLLLLALAAAQALRARWGRGAKNPPTH